MPFNKKDFINPIHIFLAILIVAIVWFAPVAKTPKESARKEKPTLLEYAASPSLILAVPEVEAGCPNQCQIKVCVDWDPNPCGSKPWDIGCCMAYATECDPECDVEPPANQSPAISHVLTCSQYGNNGWCIGNLSLDLSASDPQGSQIIISGDVNGTPFICPVGNTTCSIPLPEGAGSISYRVDAAATGLASSGTTTYLLDSSTPQLEGSVSGVTGTNGWYRSDITFTVGTSDFVSGIASTTMTVDAGSQIPYTNPIVLSDGIHTITLVARDNAGHVTQSIQTFSIDTVTPVVDVSLSGSMGLNNWYVSNLTVTPSASDLGSGIASLEAAVDGGPWISAVSGEALAFTDGIHSIQFRAMDNAGNLTQTVIQEIKVDTTTPVISLKINGTSGKNDWFVSNATVTPIADDVTSGIATLEVATDGAPWAAVNEPLFFSDGIHSYQYRVTDNAGNVTQIPPQQIKIDTVFPAIAMAGELKLGETLYFDLEDPVIRSRQVSGLWINRHVIEDDDEKYKKLTWQEIISGEKFRGEILWDGVFADGIKAKAGDYFITLKVSDAAGNETMQSAIVKVDALSFLQIIPPFILPVKAVPSNEFADPPVLSDSTFGGTNNGAIGEESNFISTGGIIAHHRETEYVKSGFMQGNQSTSTPITNSNILWGAVAIATLGATLAEWQRRREEEEARKRAEAAAQEKEGGSGKQTPGQRAYEKMMRQKRIVGESQALLNEKANGKEVVYIPSQKLEDEETNWLKKLNPVYQYEQRKAELQKKAELQAGLSAYYEGRKAGKAKEIGKPSLLEKAIDWVDKNQPDASMGVGVIVGLAAIAVTLAIVGTVTLPVLLAAAGVAALTAGATVAAGTLALNLHYDRPPITNIWENVQAAAITAAVVSGVGLFVAGGLLTQATVFAGNAIAGTCVSNPTLCANAGTLLNVVDTLEESSLVLKLAVETATGNPQAGETAIELQLEQMDGGAPGNSLVTELGEDALSHRDEVVEFLQKGHSAADDWTKYVPEYFQDDVKSGFDGDPIAITLDENVSVYRYWSDIDAESGRWTTLNPNHSPEEARAVLALPKENYAYGVTQFVIPNNTTVLVGKVAEQTSAEWSGAFAIGGGFQIFIPDDSVLMRVPLLEP
ncbi:MAG: Ig-like domain repeat protein [Anaerolineales bacterium]|nr:Ig-like domain repeat protein [Anaerolineales bacterium]